MDPCCLHHAECVSVCACVRDGFTLYRCFFNGMGSKDPRWQHSSVRNLGGIKYCFFSADSAADSAAELCLSDSREGEKEAMDKMSFVEVVNDEHRDAPCSFLCFVLYFS